MTDDILIPIEKLTLTLALRKRLLDEYGIYFDEDDDDFEPIEYDEAYARHTWLSDDDLRADFGLGDVSELQAFYNAFYWIERAKMLAWEVKQDWEAFDSMGLKFLEGAPEEVDFDVIDEIIEDLEDEFGFERDGDDEEDED